MKSKNKVNKKLVGGGETQIHDSDLLSGLNTYLMPFYLMPLIGDETEYRNFFKLKKDSELLSYGRYFRTSIRKTFDKKNIPSNTVIKLNDYLIIIFKYENEVYLTTDEESVDLLRSTIIDMLNNNKYEQLIDPAHARKKINDIKEDKKKLNEKIQEYLISFFSNDSNDSIYCLKKREDQLFFENTKKEVLYVLRSGIDVKKDVSVYTINVDDTDIICKIITDTKDLEYDVWNKIFSNKKFCDRHFLKFFQNKEITCVREGQRDREYSYFMEKANGDLIDLINLIRDETGKSITIFKNIIVQSLISVAIFQNTTGYYHNDLKLQNLLYESIKLDQNTDLLYYRYKLCDKYYYLINCPYTVKIFDFDFSTIDYPNYWQIQNNLTIRSIQENTEDSNLKNIKEVLRDCDKYFDYISILSMFHFFRRHLRRLSGMEDFINICEEFILFIFSKYNDNDGKNKNTIAEEILELACKHFPDILKHEHELPKGAIIINEDDDFIIGVEVGGGKKSKKEVLGKMRCIYKIPGDRKEYVKYKGKLITVKDYKMLNKKPKTGADKKPRTGADKKPRTVADKKPKRSKK